MKQASPLALALVFLAACATPAAAVREPARPRPDLVPVARAMTAIDAAERRGTDAAAERQRFAAAEAGAGAKDLAARFLAIYAQPRGEERWARFRALWKDVPDSAFGQVGMAAVYVEWKTLDQADRAVAAALEQEQDQWLAVRYRAEAAERKGRLDFAAVDYRTVLAADPANPEAHLGLARIARAKGDGPAAVREAEAALREAPRLFGAYAVLAGVASDRGDLGAAAAHWAAAVEASPRDREARVALARLVRREDPASAVVHWRAALREKEDVDGLAALAEAAHAARDSRAELEAVERISVLDPSSAEWRRIAEMRMAAQDWDGAERSLARALAQDPRDSGARTALGQVHLRRGAVQEAIEAFRAAGESGRAELTAVERRLNVERVARPDVTSLQRAVQALVDRTYRARLAAAPSLFGELKLRVTVGASGEASLVEVLEDTVRDPEVRACAYWNLRDAGYPQNKPGRYAFTFAFQR